MLKCRLIKPRRTEHVRSFALLYGSAQPLRGAPNVSGRVRRTRQMSVSDGRAGHQSSSRSAGPSVARWRQSIGESFHLAAEALGLRSLPRWQSLWIARTRRSWKSRIGLFTSRYLQLSPGCVDPFARERTRRMGRYVTVKHVWPRADASSVWIGEDRIH